MGTAFEISCGPTGGTVAVWRIGAGRVHGVDVSGQVVLVVAGRPGCTTESPATRVVLLDEMANPEQVLALLDALRGRRDGFCQIPIEYSAAGDRHEISVPDRLRAVIHLDRMVASEVSVALPEHGLEWLARDVPVSFRRFSVGTEPEEEECRA